MRNFFVFVLLLLSLSSCNLFRKTPKEASNVLQTSVEKFSYALGMTIGENFLEAGLDSVNTDFLLRGINDVIKQQSKLLTPEEAYMVIQEFIGKAEQQKSAINQEVEQKFLDQNKKRAGVKTTASGLQYEILEQGSGPLPTIVDEVTVHYHGTLMDGTVFDSSVERDDPMTFPVTSVIPGMQEALLMMPVGSKWKLYVPSELAYGETGAGGVIDPYAPLVFEVELIKIE
jgi:FKBP-type peptidyl-prolyl cis-trans isomerase FklB